MFKFSSGISKLNYLMFFTTSFYLENFNLAYTNLISKNFFYISPQIRYRLCGSSRVLSSVLGVEDSWESCEFLLSWQYSEEMK